VTDSSLASHVGETVPEARAPLTVARVAVRLRRGTVLALVALGLHALVWIALPAHNVHPDSLDELLQVEAGRMSPMAKHPADMPALGLVWATARALGHQGRAIRPVQLWNGAWMTAALAGLLCFARRSQGRWTAVSAGVAALLAGSNAALHLAVDPHNTYCPPGLAFLTWGLALSLGPPAGDARLGRFPWQAWCAATACLVAAVLFHPMVAVACPLAALEWLRRARSLRRPAAVLAGLGPVLVPGAVLLAFMVALAVERVVGGPYGVWSAVTPQLVWNAGRNAVLWRDQAFAPIFWGERGVQTWLATSAYLGVGVALAAAGALVCRSRAALARFLPYGLAALTTALFIAWWGPGNFVFWLVPAWFLGLGVLRAAPRGPAQTASIAGAVLLAEAALVLALNGPPVWKDASAENRQEQRARSIASRVDPADMLVFLGWKPPGLAYYSDVRCGGILSFHGQRRSGASTLELLEREVLGAQSRGGALYLEMPRAGQGWISREHRALLPHRDFDDADFERMQLGRELRAGGYVFREVVALGPSR
jgi:hypothetical protein